MYALGCLDIAYLKNKKNRVTTRAHIDQSLWFIVLVIIDCHTSYDESKGKMNLNNYIKSHCFLVSFPSSPKAREKIPRNEVEYCRHRPQKLDSEFNLLLAK